MSVTITRNPNLTKAQRPEHIEHVVERLFIEKQLEFFTGVHPTKCPGFDSEREVLVSLPLLNLNQCTRQDIIDSFNNIWTLTELLFQSLKTPDTYVRPPYHGLRHPMIFYYGHPAVLYYNKMRLAGFFNEPIDLYLEKILETGVDEMSWDDMSKNEMAWPSVFEVWEYRKKIYHLVLDVLTHHPDLDAANIKKTFLADSPWWSVWMGMEHEKIHLETSSVLIRELPVELVSRPKYFAPIHPDLFKDPSLKPGARNVKNKFLKNPGGVIRLGKDRQYPSYGWDNEYGFRELSINEFFYSEYQITNAEFYEFVSTHAYVQDEFWSSEGLQFRKFRNTKRPCFWAAVGPEGSHEYELRTLFEIVPMPWDAPCEVNFHEACAFINWKMKKDRVENINYRLLTEAEFMHLTKSDRDEVLQTTSLQLDKMSANRYRNNHQLSFSSVKNVDASFWGNAWHWMLDQFNPLNEFAPHALYDDFSTPCFDGKHQMIKGGSFISCGDEASIYSRFHFRPHFYQHASFRMAYTADGSKDNGSTKIYEEKEYIHQKRFNVLDQLNKPDWWKNVQQPLELSIDEMSAFFDLTQSFLLDYEKNFKAELPAGHAYDSQTHHLKSDFKLPLIQTKNFPNDPQSLKGLLQLLFKELAPTAQKPGHPRFMAYVAGRGNFISALSQMIAMTLNPFSGHYFMAPGLVALEEEAKKWFLNLLGFNDQVAGGFFTTGSSLAMLEALRVARKTKLSHNLSFDYSKITAYVSRDGHHSILKAWTYLGFNPALLRMIDLDAHMRMDDRKCEEKIREDRKLGFHPLMIVATLGSTKTGAVDPLEKLAAIAKKEDLWLHADGAYGLPFLLTATGKELFPKIEACHSLTLDLHKSMALPYGTGLLIVQNKNWFKESLASDQSYMPPESSDVLDYADQSIELSRDFRGLRVWLPLKVLGVGPFILNLEEKLKLAQYTYDQLSKNALFKMHHQPDLSIMAFSHVDGEASTRKCLEEINASGKLFLSPCTIGGHFSLRLCFLSYSLHFKETEELLALLTETFEKNKKI